MGSGVPITWGVGAKLGGNLAWFNNGYYNSGVVVGFVAGGFVEMNFAPRWTMSVDLLYSSAGSKSKYTDIRMESSYLILPVLINFSPFRNFDIKAGVQPSVMMSMWRFDGDSRRSDVTEQYNRFDLSIPVGVSYSINRILIDARYNIGLTDIISNNTEDRGSFNSVFTLSVGFRFL